MFFFSDASIRGDVQQLSEPPDDLVQALASRHDTCVSYTDNSLKKITLVNCLIIIILIIVVAANINEGNQ